MIVKERGKYVVKSEDGKPMGAYDTREEAEERLKQIEMHKHMRQKQSDHMNAMMRGKR